MQGAISTTYVRLLYEYLQQRGLDGATVLGEAPPDASALGLSRITMRRWAQLLDRAALQLPEPALGLRIGAI
ncbi:UNVERIFIED_CONTAM: AraC family transcriptional regulator, partial [Salmonella enterica subsp. enterica serovar Weltevreden]